MNKVDNIGGQIRIAVIGQVCIHSAMTGTRMAAPLLALTLGYGKDSAGLLVALFALSQIFLALPASNFTDKHGLCKSLKFCVAVSFIGVGIASIWPIFSVLCISALICGASAGTATIAMQRHVGRICDSPSDLKRAFSFLSIGPAFANFLGPIMAGLLIDYSGFRTAFAFLACLPLITWILTKNLQESIDVKGHKNSEKVAPWILLKNPDVRRLLIINTLMNIAWDFHGFMIPVLGHERGTSASAIGMILGTFAIAAVLVRLSMSAIVNSVREWALLTVAITFSGVVLFIYPLAATPELMAILSALLGLALGSVQPIVLSLLHHITPSNRQGQVLAVRLILADTSALTIPAALGVIGGVAGVSVVFWIVGAFIAVGGQMGLGLRKIPFK